MKLSQSYWDSDDEDGGARTYLNVRPAAAGIQYSGGHNLASAMHRDYVTSRMMMTKIDNGIQRRLKIIISLKKDLREWNAELHGDISGLIYQQIENNEHEIAMLRRQWSFYANNYHLYDDVGAKTDNAYHAYMTYEMNQ